MKKIKILLFIAVTALMMCFFTACNDQEMPQTVEEYCTVSFDTKGGNAMESIKVKAGTQLSAPSEPQKEGYVFNGWSYDGKEWLFSVQTVNSDITLSARWVSAESLFEYEVKDGEVSIKGYRGGLSSTSIKIPAVIGGLPVTSIADGAFDEVDKNTMGRVILGENIVSVGNSAFYGSEELMIVIEGKLRSIGEKAFYGCAKLETIELGEGLEKIPYQAFYGCTSLKSVVLPKSAKLIEENAFEGCVGLKTVMMHDSLQTVNDGAFSECNALEVVYYYGTEEKWQGVDMASGNEALEGIKFYMYSETEPEGEDVGKCWHFDKNGKVRVW